MLTRPGAVALIVMAAVAGQGCAAVAIPPLNGAGLSASPDVNYTLDGIAYRTFEAPVDQMRRATLTALKRMDLTLTNEELKEDGGRDILAMAGERTVHVELERLTARTTRMRITAKHGWAWRDRATAGEIIVQTERTLNDVPAVTQRAR